jgi:hypothetical protein
VPFHLSRVPWLPIALSAAVLLSAGFAVQPVREATTLTDSAESFLVKPFWYVAIAPLSNVLDMITLMSARQHIWTVGTLTVLFAAHRVIRHARRRATWRAHVTASTVFLVAIVATYAAVAAFPRPMARLEVNNASVIRVDFHTHTSASHDGRAGFTAQRNRAWHRAAGFDVAFIADHASVSGAEQAMASNPAPGRDDVVLLQSMEVTWTGEHVGILGAQRAYKGLTTDNLRDVDEQALALASLLGGREPVLVWHHPRRLNRIPPARGTGTHGVRAIEVVSGSPNGMDETRSKRADIVQFAERNNLAVVSATDNHGWGRTAPGWTLLIVPNWRAMDAEALQQEIERAIRDGGWRATRVIERRVADPGAGVIPLAASAMTVPARMLTTLSTDERVAWLVWSWLIWAIVAWRRRSRERAAS